MPKFSFLFLDGDHDSGVDENTQRNSPKKATGATPKNEAGVIVARVSRPPKTWRPKPAQRSQSVPKPFTAYGTPPSQEKKGEH